MLPKRVRFDNKFMFIQRTILYLQRLININVEWTHYTSLSGVNGCLDCSEYRKSLPAPFPMLSEINNFTEILCSMW